MVLTVNVFDFVNSIFVDKKNLMEDINDEKDYVPFITNRAMSNFVDTILYGQEMNSNSHLDKKLQYDYLRNSIRPAKRFAKWPKKIDDNNIEIIKKYYQCNNSKAKSALKILTKEQMQHLKKVVNQD